MKLIIDTDPGIDDAMAILYAAHDPTIELLGLTSVFGNVTTEMATRNALHLVEFAGLHVPVAEGAKQPLVIPVVPPTAHVHGVQGFGEVTVPKPNSAAIKQTAAEFLCRMARKHQGELTVCAIGPLTNIAHAIRLDPQFAQNVKSIVVMGGAAFVPGNITQFAEANTFHDPHAFNVMAASGAKVCMVGLDITDKVVCTKEDFSEIAELSPALGGFLQKASGFYLDFYRDHVGQIGCGLHDPTAIIACTNPNLFEIKPLVINALESGEWIGQTIAVDASNAPSIDVCIGGDVAAIKHQFISMFGNARQGAE